MTIRLPDYVTARQLDAMTCSRPHCDHSAHGNAPLVMFPRCHPKAGTQTKYYGGGVLSIHCASCDRVVITVHLQ